VESIAIRPTGFCHFETCKLRKKTAEVESNARSRLMTIGQCLQKRNDRILLVFC
jgi:hypothetical protein